MEPVLREARPEGGPESDLNLLIEKGFLLLGSIEFQIEEHLMANGTRIDPETRFFMAQVRDAAGDAAAKLLDEARTRLDAAPAEGSAEAKPREHARDETAVAAIPAPPPPAASATQPATAYKRRRGPGLRRALADTALGTACAAVLVTLALGSHADRTSSPAGSAMASLAADEAVAPGPSADDRAEREPIEASRRSSSVTKLAEAAVAPTPGGPGFDALDAASHPDGQDDWAASEPWELTAAGSVALGSFPPYPDPRAGMELVETIAAAAEERLALSRNERREVQRRLALAAFDPQLFDGIFGPATRDALGAWQEAAGLPATGFLDRQALALLREQTEEAYRTWKLAEKVRARREAHAAVLTSPVPQAPPARPEKCRRLPSGKIVYGRGVRCDFRGLRENLARIFG